MELQLTNFSIILDLNHLLGGSAEVLILWVSRPHIHQVHLVLYLFHHFTSLKWHWSNGVRMVVFVKDTHKIALRVQCKNTKRHSFRKASMMTCLRLDLGFSFISMRVTCDLHTVVLIWEHFRSLNINLSVVSPVSDSSDHDLYSRSGPLVNFILVRENPPNFSVGIRGCCMRP